MELHQRRYKYLNPFRVVLLISSHINCRFALYNNVIISKNENENKVVVNEYNPIGKRVAVESTLQTTGGNELGMSIFHL